MAHIRAGDVQLTQRVSEFVRELAGKGWYHSFELPGGRVIEGFQTVAQLRARLARFSIPDDLRGKRVLDIGCWDGWFSFEMERRGAEVVAADIVERETFLAAREALGSKVEFVLSDVYQLTPERVGRFDIVLFLGVLYHLKHPLLALERVCALTTDLALVESFVIDDGADLAAAPLMEYYENSELVGRFDNWCGPNTSCLLAFCRTAGFATVEPRGVVDQRAHVICSRHWPAPPSLSGMVPRHAPPVITGVVNQRNGEPVFDSRVDEFMSVFFKSDQPDLSRAWSCRRSKDSASTRPALRAAEKAGGKWTVPSAPPPVRPPAPFACAPAAARSASPPPSRSTPRGIAPRLLEFSGPLEIQGLADGTTWEDNLVRLERGNCVSVWVRGLPEDATRSPRGRAPWRRPQPRSCSSPRPTTRGLRQINVRLPAQLTPGDYDVLVVYGTSVTEPAAAARSSLNRGVSRTATVNRRRAAPKN
jgi:tRNA (mo5U34)-methyltransferase